MCCLQSDFYFLCNNRGLWYRLILVHFLLSCLNCGVDTFFLDYHCCALLMCLCAWWRKVVLFMLVKIKFLGCTELWCEPKICDYACQHVATLLPFTYLNNSELWQSRKPDRFDLTLVSDNQPCKWHNIWRVKLSSLDVQDWNCLRIGVSGFLIQI